MLGEARSGGHLAVTHCFAKEMILLSVMDKPAFREILKKIDPQYEPPNRKYLTATAIPAVYMRTRSAVANEVQVCFFLFSYHRSLVK